MVASVFSLNSRAQSLTQSRQSVATGNLHSFNQCVRALISYLFYELCDCITVFIGELTSRYVLL